MVRYLSLNICCSDCCIVVFRSCYTKATKSKSADINVTLNKRKSFGQPTWETHPHLLKEGEVTPSIQRSEYQSRRQKLIESIAAHAVKRNKDFKRHLVNYYNNVIKADITH